MDANKKKTKPKGHSQPRQRRYLVDPGAMAYRGWERLGNEWTANECKLFVGWCHIGKLFPYHRHKQHLSTNMANLHYCRDDQFRQRCIEVYNRLYNTVTVKRNEVPLFLCQMVYAEVVLSRRVDWRTIKGTKIANTIPTKDIPTAGPAGDPWAGLGKRKHIKPGVPDAEFEWSDHSSSIGSDDVDEEVPLDNKDTMQEEWRRASQSQAIYVTPLAVVEPTWGPPVEKDEVWENMRKCLQEIEDDMVCAPYEMEDKVDPPLSFMALPQEPFMPELYEEPFMPELYEEPLIPEFEEDIDAVAPQHTATQETKESYEAILKMLLTELEEKKNECEILRNLAQEDVGDESVLSHQAEFHCLYSVLTKQHDEISEVEAFFLNFTHDEGGGSSSSSNEFANKRIAQILLDCKTAVQQIDQEKQSLEETQRQWNHLVEVEDQAPLNRYVQLDAHNVAWQQETSPTEVADLKKKLAACLKREHTLKARIDHGKVRNSWDKCFKTFLMQMNAAGQTYPLRLMEREEEIELSKVESRKRERED